MPSALFQLDQVKDLPLWAQVLIASRMTRRATLGLPPDTPKATRDLMLAACDALDACATAGRRPAAQLATIQQAGRLQPPVAAHAAALSLHYAADAAHAAEDSNDFSAAESACVSSAWQAVAHASEADGLSPLQTRILLASDLDLLRFNCQTFRIGRYDGLGPEVMQRLTPIYPPDAARESRVTSS